MTPVPDVLLVFPPYWDTCMPYLSVPTLAAYLRSRGLRVEAHDLNITCARFLLTEKNLEQSLASAEAARGAWPTVDSKPFRDNLALCESVWSDNGGHLIQPFVPGAPRPDTVETYAAFWRNLYWSLRIASAPFHPLILTPTGLELGAIPSRLALLADIVARERPMPADEQIESFAVAQARRGIQVCGISVAGPSQLLPALALARRFKRLSPDTFVCVGGAQIPYIIDALHTSGLPFPWVDAFVTGEGEIALADLCLAIRDGHDVSRIAGLHLFRDGRFTRASPAATLALADLPAPDFEGFEPRRYLANDDAVALTFARGCSWGRCAFCTQYICFDTYRSMPAEQVSAHLTAVSRQIPIKTITLNDENVTPRRLQEFGILLRDRLPDARWFALARLAPQLANRRLAEDLATSGCSMLSLGLESADQSVLNLNAKGIVASRVPAILRTLHAAGIWVHLFVVFGLPGESWWSARRTLQFVVDNRSATDSLSVATFRLERGSVIAADPERFGITRLPVPEDYCDLKLPFVTRDGLTEKEAAAFSNALLAALVGTPQCPIEQTGLRGQFVLQLLRDSGISTLRAIMAERGRQTEQTSTMLDGDNVLFARFSATTLGADLERKSTGCEAVLADRARHLFLTLDRQGLALLRLRSFGLPLAFIRAAVHDESSNDASGSPAPISEIDTRILALLATRCLQESGAFDEGPDRCEHPETACISERRQL